MQIIDRGYLTYVDPESQEKLTVGTITKERDLQDMHIYYCFNIDMERYNQLEHFGMDVSDDNLITAIWLQGRTRITFGHVPYFIVERTPDRRRGDIDEILKRRGVPTYNQFSLLLATEGCYPLDNWRVFREPFNSIDVIEGVAVVPSKK